MLEKPQKKKKDYIQNGYVTGRHTEGERPGFRRLFTLPQDHVHEAADESEGKSHPGQDEGVAVAAFAQQVIEFAVLLVKFLAPVCVDGSPNHDTQTGHELDDGRQDEPLSLLEAEELQQKDKEGDAGEDGGEDHGGLHGLHHRVTRKLLSAGQVIDLCTVCVVGAHSPEVS